VLYTKRWGCVVEPARVFLAGVGALVVIAVLYVLLSDRQELGPSSVNYAPVVLSFPAETEMEIEAGTLAEPPSPALPAAVDVERLVRQAQLAFREEDGRWVARRPGYSIEATHDAFSIAPTRTSGRVAEPAALQIEAVALGREGVEVREATGSASVTEEGILEIPRGPATERLASREDGLEQSWRFETKPPRTW